MLPNPLLLTLGRDKVEHLLGGEHEAEEFLLTLLAVEEFLALLLPGELLLLLAVLDPLLCRLGLGRAGEHFLLTLLVLTIEVLSDTGLGDLVTGLDAVVVGRLEHLLGLLSLVEHLLGLLAADLAQLLSLLAFVELLLLMVEAGGHQDTGVLAGLVQLVVHLLAVVQLLDTLTLDLVELLGVDRLALVELMSSHEDIIGTVVPLLLLVVGAGGHEDTILTDLVQLVVHLLAVVQLLDALALVEVLDDTVGLEHLLGLLALVELLLLIVLTLVKLVAPVVGEVALLKAAVGLAHAVVELLGHTLALGDELILLGLAGVHVHGAVGVGLAVKQLAKVLVALLTLANLEVGLLAMGLHSDRTGVGQGMLSRIESD